MKPDHTGFENGKLVPVADFEYPQDEADDAPQGATAAATEEALDVLRFGLLVVLFDGHRDAMPARCASLAMLIGLFETQAHAAAAVGLNRATICRAVRTMRAKIRRSFRNEKRRTKAPCRKARA